MTRPLPTTGPLCIECGEPLPTPGSAVSPRKYCSNACTNTSRRRRYSAKPRTREARPSVSDRLWRRVERRGPDECWEWRGYCMPGGHGQIGIAGRKVTTTHRVAWESANGPIPDGLLIRHRCDNPPCCNPAHLELGTIADNARDAVERGRTARGFQLPHTRLSIEDVREIRHRYRRGNAATLAEEFGVTAKYVAAVAAGSERADV